jgi:hypothetical protein
MVNEPGELQNLDRVDVSDHAELACVRCFLDSRLNTRNNSLLQTALRVSALHRSTQWTCSFQPSRLGQGTDGLVERGFGVAPM